MPTPSELELMKEYESLMKTCRQILERRRTLIRVQEHLQLSFDKFTPEEVNLILSAFDDAIHSMEREYDSAVDFYLTDVRLSLSLLPRDVENKKTNSSAESSAIESTRYHCAKCKI